MGGGLLSDGAVCRGTAHPPGPDHFAVPAVATGRRDHRRVLASTQSHQMMLCLKLSPKNRTGQASGWGHTQGIFSL